VPDTIELAPTGRRLASSWRIAKVDRRNRLLGLDKTPKIGKRVFMSNSNFPGLSPIWLIGLALVLGTTITVLVPVTFSGGDKLTPASWLGFAGSVLGGSITVLGLFIATRNVNRQLRINLISREEERIEEQLPGLIQARDELSRFMKETDSITVIRDLVHFGENVVVGNALPSDFKKALRLGLKTGYYTITIKTVEDRLPLADAVFRRRIFILLVSLKNSSDLFYEHHGATSLSQSDEDTFNERLERLRAFVRETERKIALYEQRLTTFRAELEQHFDR